MVESVKYEAQSGSSNKVCSPVSAAVEDIIVTKYFIANEERLFSLGLSITLIVSGVPRLPQSIVSRYKIRNFVLCFTDL